MIASPAAPVILIASLANCSLFGRAHRNWLRAATSCNRPATASLASRMRALAISEQTRKFVALWHCGKPFGLKTGLDLRVCKPPDPGASVNQDSNSG